MAKQETEVKDTEEKVAEVTPEKSAEVKTVQFVKPNDVVVNVNPTEANLAEAKRLGWKKK